MRLLHLVLPCFRRIRTGNPFAWPHPRRGVSVRPTVRLEHLLLEFNPDGVVAALVDILDRVRALGFHPAHPLAGRG